MTAPMTRSRSKKILAGLYKLYGDTPPDLNYRNIYELTVAVVVSAQTTDRQVNKVTVELFDRYPDFSSLAGADYSDVERIIRTIGFFRTKAKNIIALSGMVCSRYGGVLPESLELLVGLPGVGRKSANVIISIGYGKPGLAVDTHVARISNRLGYSDKKSPDKIEKDLCAVIDPSDWRITHLLFIRHGRALCKARNPLCGVCPVVKYCAYYSGIISSSLKQNP
jgi:endonuclease-3